MNNPAPPDQQPEPDTDQSQLLPVNEDNRHILTDYLSALTAEAGGYLPVTVVAAQLSIRGLLLLLPALRHLTHQRTPVRVLVGVTPDDRTHNGAATQIPTNDPLLRTADETLRAEINNLPLTHDGGLALIELLNLLDSRHLHCRREQHRALGAAGLVLPNTNRALLGSPNLLPAHLTRDRHWLGQLTPAAMPAARQLADRWWDEAEPFALADLIRTKLLPYDPQLVYLRMLHLAYGDEVNARTWDYLRDYQADGVAKALAILKTLRGALICDDVGLGKTDQALAVARELVAAGAERILLLCPASLQQHWQQNCDSWRLAAHICSYDKLIRIVDDNDNDNDNDNDTGDWITYDLIICDEAHHLRTPTTKKITAVRHVIAQSPRPSLLLLTATPVNNTGLDLFELLSLADPTLEPQWHPCKSTNRKRSRTREGTAALLHLVCLHADTLPEESAAVHMFHEELDQRMVRRSRWLLQKEYPGSAKSFPERTHRRVTYNLNGVHKKLMVDVIDALGEGRYLTEQGHDRLAALRSTQHHTKPLKMAAYIPYQYALSPPKINHATAMAVLIRIMLLKRLESSPAALAATTRRMAARVQLALRDLDRGRVCLPHPGLQRRLKDAISSGDASDDLTNPSDPQTDYLSDFLTDTVTPAALTPYVRPANEFDVTALRTALTSDLKILHQLATDAARAAADDRKFAALLEELARIAHERPGEKIVILMSSRATAADLDQRLHAATKTDRRLRHLRDKIANAAPPTPLSGKELLNLVAQFAPRTAAQRVSTVARTYARDTYQLLLGTDQLSEGHNLQQASIIINYDLPWNPQALEQRIGRVDRQDAELDTVLCITLEPDTGLGLFLRLLDILRNKIDIAALTVGVPSIILPGTEATVRNFAAALQTLDTGPRPVTITEREHQRAILGNALRIDGTLEALHALPTPVGAIHPTPHPQQGAVFCFHIDTPDGTTHTLFCHVEDTPQRTTTFDRNRCLRLTHTDLHGWNPPSLPHPLTNHPDATHFQALLLQLIDHARQRIAGNLDIPAEHAGQRIRLIAWMALLRHPRKPTP
ncbi:SNF2-related protein [Actinoplanes rectilineatus]|uniref:SNF2-related protein n=1 Tax=Actinoplanes rectilineatus TaxID=113571 RepID=UPI0005F2C601|nr:SNF2-related protein [Actinoplanes rectilineatus]